jgi:hypothetical protein
MVYDTLLPGAFQVKGGGGVLSWRAGSSFHAVQGPGALVPALEGRGGLEGGQPLAPGDGLEDRPRLRRSSVSGITASILGVESREQPWTGAKSLDGFVERPLGEPHVFGGKCLGEFLVVAIRDAVQCFLLRS